jgi:inner membrane protein
MDSLSQFALGAAIGTAVMGPRTAVWKAAVWGGVCATLPDLDAFIDHGDPVSNMTLHRADSHALFWLSLASPLVALAVSRLVGEFDRFRRWWLAVWLALVTHPLLDLMTVYGTQLGRPFTDHPFAVGSIFIIDPLYTAALLVGVIAALAWGGARGQRWNRGGLWASTAYLVWSFGAQQFVTGIAQTALRAQGIDVRHLLVTPTPFNTVLWRIVAVTPDGYVEGFRSLLDRGPDVRFDRFERGEALREVLRGQPAVERMAWFTGGLYKLTEQGSDVVLSDLRMGQEPYYTFAFVVAQRHSDVSPLAAPRSAGQRPEVARVLRWMGPRLLGEPLPPPR